MIKEGGRVMADIGFSAVAIPKPGLELEQSKELWWGASKENKILDYGEKSEPLLLVASERSRQVIYEFVPELSNGHTIEQAMAHMKSAGMDVRGVGPNTLRGTPTIIVSEKY